MTGIGRRSRSKLKFICEIDFLCIFFLKQKKSNSDEVDFAEFVLRTARELSKDKFQAEVSSRTVRFDTHRSLFRDN